MYAYLRCIPAFDTIDCMQRNGKNKTASSCDETAIHFVILIKRLMFLVTSVMHYNYVCGYFISQ